MLTHHTPELTNQITGIHMRPRSAESARKPKYKISDFKSRAATTGRNMHSEFSIVIPSQYSARGGNLGGGDILNLEEQPEAELPQKTLSLGPTVVTDDEYSMSQEVTEKSPPGKHHQRKRGHRRTASTGSNIVPFSNKEKEVSGAKSSNPIPLQSSGQKQQQQQQQPHMHTHLLQGSGKPPKSLPKHPRPGSAGSSRQDMHVRQESSIHSMQLTKTAHEVTEYMHGLIDNHLLDEPKLSVKDAKETLDCPVNKDTTATGGKTQGGGSTTKSGAKPPGGVGGGGGSGGKAKGRFDLPRNKPANKSTDSNETTSSEGNGFSSKGSSQSDSSGGGPRKDLKDRKRSGDFAVQGSGGRGGGGGGRVLSSASFHQKTETALAIDLSRTESMSSTCSALSIYGTFPSRNHSFTYDGGESSTYSHESLEIGDSEENLQVQLM